MTESGPDQQATPTSAPEAAPKTPSTTLRNLNLIVVPALCLGALGLMYTRLSGDIRDLQMSQRQLVTEVAALRRTPLIDLANAPIRGREDAVVTMVEFSDYECPFCIKYFQEILPRIETDYISTGKIRYAFRDLPVDELHPAAIRAHEASRCAGEQDRFWQMHTRLFSAPGTHGDDQLRARAQDAGLNLSAFDECLASGRTTADIRQVGNQAMTMGASGTPAFFLGVYDPALGQVRVLRGLSGAQPYEVFAPTLDLLLQQVQ
jgi:protein-disulfide isomerase